MVASSGTMGSDGPGGGSPGKMEDACARAPTPPFSDNVKKSRRVISAILVPYARRPVAPDAAIRKSQDAMCW